MPIFRILIPLLLLVFSAGLNAEPTLLHEMLNDKGRLGTIVRATNSNTIVEMTKDRITSVATNKQGPGTWGYEWRKLGEYYEIEGDELAKNGSSQEALRAYEAALVIYRLGYLPDNFFKEERLSYDRFKDVMYKINNHLKYPFEVVRIPFEGNEIVVHLYLPKNVPGTEGKPPLVLYTGGTDGAKETGAYATQGLAERGIAVASFDLGGTGESMAWYATADAHKIHRRILDYFEAKQQFDYSRIGLIGGSYGGYYALMMAVDEPRLKAVVNVCGLVHSAFNIPATAIEKVMQNPTASMRSAMRRLGYDPDNMDFDHFNATIAKSPVSLKDLGYVGTGEKTINIPFLTVNGTRDPIVSMDDFRLIEEATSQGEIWLLGQGLHCAPKYSSVVGPDIINWLDEQLNDTMPSQQR